MLSEAEISNILETGIEAAVEIRKAVQKLDSQERTNRTGSIEFPNQYYIDVLADEIVHDYFSDFNGTIISEERKFSKEDLRQNPLALVIDPIDGSTNAAKSIDYWCFSLAVLYEGKTIAGLVVDQASHKIYRASEYEPATLFDSTGKQIVLADKQNNENVGTRADNFSFSTICFRTSQGPTIPFRHLRYFGASALSICEVSSGALDAYIDDKNIFLRPWDLLAAEYIALKSNCSVLRRDSKGYLAATGVLVTRSNTLLKEFKRLFPNFFVN